MKTRFISAVWVGLVLVACCGASHAQVNQDTPGYFPFWVPAFDVAESFTDMSFLNPVPAGAEGRVTIRDGHFYDGAGKRVRLLGSNVTFRGAFPDKENAEAIAGHLRKLGVNVIRFHHLDCHSGRYGIWNEDKTTFNPEQLDRLDWFIYQLKQHGIYSNINLHVSRTYPGMPDSYPRTFKYGKGVDNFYPPFIQLQKDYARDLLTHTNPYTKTTYAKEPAIVVVELNNENSLTAKKDKSLRDLPEPFLGELLTLWRAWLKKKYGTTETLRTEWATTAEPLAEELLTNRDFKEGPKGWSLEQGAPESMKAERVEDAGVPSGQALKITTSKQGHNPWSLQVHQTGLDLVEHAPYTLCFRARADEPRTVSLSVRLDMDPWTMCGLDTAIDLGTEWREFRFTFQCVEPKPKHGRLSFGFRNQLGTFWLADTSLRRGGWIGLPKDQSFEANNIAIPDVHSGPALRSDFRQFQSDTECKYVAEMMHYLREDLGVEAPLCCTQASYGGLMGMYREGTLSDFIDMHSYWQHPRFPGKPWDMGDWRIQNTAMSLSAEYSGVRFLSLFHLEGKPFTASEYDHPAPSDYAVEMFPMVASFGAYQDWDGIYQFNWSSSPIPNNEKKISGFFELWNHPGKLAFMPIASLMFRMGAVAEGADRAFLTLPTGDLAKYDAFAASYHSKLSELALSRPVGYRLVEGGGEPVVPPYDEDALPFRSNSGQIGWEPVAPDHLAYTVNAPAVRVAIGKIGGVPVRLGDVTITVDTKHEWAAVAVGALDGKPIAESKRVLIVAAGRVENSNMGWDEDRTTVGKKWGDVPIVAEGIEARIQLPAGKRVVKPLDGTGTPKPDVTVPTGADGCRIGPAFETLWYAVSSS